MKISQLYTYPIKSFQGTKTLKARLTKYGFLYDRSFMLLQDKGGGRYENMSLVYHPKMTLFSTDIRFPDGNFKGEITVTYAPPDGEPRTLIVPLQPETVQLFSMDITIQDSATIAYNMGDRYNSWFSNCFGFSVVFVYTGSNTRAVLPRGNGTPTTTFVMAIQHHLLNIIHYRQGGGKSRRTDRLPGMRILSSCKSEILRHSLCMATRG